MFKRNEAKTRKELIDPALQQAGWDINNPEQVGLEIPVDGFDPFAWARLKKRLDRISESGGIYNVDLPAGVSDYALYRPNGEIIAIVEAKRTSIDARLAQTQADLQAVFLEMFGDPIANPKGWTIEELGERISFITSGSRGWAKYYSDGGAIFLRIQNVTRNQLLLDDLTYVQVPAGAEGQRTRVRDGDLLLSITADLGRTAVIPENFPEAYINQHLALLRLEKLNPTFVAGFISTPGGKAQIDWLNREGVKSGLNFDDIRGYQIFIPPLSLQDKYAHIVHKFERFRAQQREAERQAEHLFQTLLHQAFAGELESGCEREDMLSIDEGDEGAEKMSIGFSFAEQDKEGVHQLSLPVD